MIIKNLNEWLNESNNDGFLEPTKENLRKFNLGPSKVTINPDGSIDYDGNIDLSGYSLNIIPFKFNKVIGDFKCSNNKIVTLEGCPREVTGYFSCSSNQLVSLEGSPNSIAGHFDCSGNQLVSLAGATTGLSDLIFRCTPNLILYNPTKYTGSFDLDEHWEMNDSSRKKKLYAGTEHLKMAFERLDELSYFEVLGVRSGLSKVDLPEDLRDFCQGKIQECLDKNSNSTFRKGYKELDDEILDMF